MAVTSNIDQVIEKLNALTQAGERIDFSDALAAGVNAARAAMQNRIFNTGLDANDITLGGYVGKQTKITERKLAKDKKKRKRLLQNIATFDQTAGFSEYEKKRLSHGRQIAFKDLEFTGSLRRSIVTATESTRQVACIIINEQDALIAGYQEEQIARIRGGAGRANIFALSDTERKELIEVTNTALGQLYDRLLNTK